jgi:hypothetical protein
VVVGSKVHDFNVREVLFYRYVSNFLTILKNRFGAVA